MIKVEILTVILVVAVRSYVLRLLTLTTTVQQQQQQQQHNKEHMVQALSS